MSSMEPMRHLCDGSLGGRWEIRNQMLGTSSVIQTFWKVGNMRICCFLWLIVSWYIRWALVLSGVRMWWPHGCPPPFQLPLIYWFTTRSWRICQVWYCFSWISISVDDIPHIARVISTTHLYIAITIFRLIPALLCDAIPVSSSPVIVLHGWHGLSVLQQTVGGGYLEVGIVPLTNCFYSINIFSKWKHSKRPFQSSDQLHFYRYGVTIPSANFTWQWTIHHFKFFAPWTEVKKTTSRFDYRGH